MDRYHGKPVDPRRFKQHELSDLETKVDRKRTESRRYLEMVDTQVPRCPICASAERSEVASMHGVEYCSCEDCGHVYQPRRLSQEALLEFYESDEEYAEKYVSEEQLEYRLENITKPKFEFVLDRVEPEQGRWLDVGCGVGASIHFLQAEGWEATGLEISEDCVRTATRQFGVDLVPKTLKDYANANPGAAFDVVSMYGYLDLVADPVADLQIAFDLLTPRGYIAVHVPRFDSITAKVQTALPDRGIRYFGWNVLHVFTEKSLTRAFETTGFEPLAAWFYGLDFYELLNSLCLETEGFVDSELYTYFMDRLNRFQQVIDEDEMSDYFTVVAQKV